MGAKVDAALCKHELLPIRGPSTLLSQPASRIIPSQLVRHFHRPVQLDWRHLFP